jgi:hypothetical protein
VIYKMLQILPLFVVAVLCACGESTAEKTDTGTDGTTSDTDTDTDSDTGANPDAATDSDSTLLIRKSCKRGVAYGHHSPADMAALSPGISWWYNWYDAPDAELGSRWLDAQVSYVPMRWGENFDVGQALADIPIDTTTLLGFNEPNFFSQANLSAARAAELWPQLESLADTLGLQLVSPAVNFCGGGCHGDGPVAYLEDFFAACRSCRVDAIAIHIYVGCDETSAGLQDNRAQWLINHVEMYKEAFDRPLWLTEFACAESPSVAEQKAFLEDAVAYLENEPRIERYAWFSGRADNMTNVDLLGDDGQLTELGQAYVNAPFTDSCPCPPGVQSIFFKQFHHFEVHTLGMVVP